MMEGENRLSHAHKLSSDFQKGTLTHVPTHTYNKVIKIKHVSKLYVSIKSLKG